MIPIIAAPTLHRQTVPTLARAPTTLTRMLAALIDIPPNVGYAAVFALIAVETMGIPVPGETALIAGALLAQNGQMDIVLLVVVASAAATVGDNIGFAIGRKGGRKLLMRPGPFHAQRLR